MAIYQHGGDIYTTAYRIDFSANINPFGTPQSVIRAAQEAVLLCENYPDSQYRLLAEAIAGKEGIEKEQVICGNGAAELIFAAAAAFCPKKALLCIPGFLEYEQALKTTGCEIVFYELKQELGFVCQRDYLDYLTDDLDMVFLCNPNNPTGILMEPELIVQILNICREKRILVILDSCFIDFLEEEESYDFTKKIGEYPNLLILKAFTKIYAMAGLRLGYGICSDIDLLEKCRTCLQPWSVSVVAQAAGIEALKETEYVKQTKMYITDQRTWLKEELSHLVDIVYEGKANYLFFHGPEDLGRKCREQGILIRDCSNYRGLSKGYYRIAVRTQEENRELIRVIREILA